MQIFSSTGVRWIKRKARAVFHGCRLCGWSGALCRWLDVLTWVCCMQGFWEALWEPQGDAVFWVNKVLVQCNQTAAPCLNGENCVWLQSISLIQSLWLIFSPMRPMPWGLIIHVLQYERDSLSLQRPCSPQQAAVKSECGLGIPLADRLCLPGWQSRAPGDSLYKIQISHPFSR